MQPNKMDVHFSSEKQDWGTPQDFFDECNEKYGPFDVDVCATSGNSKVSRYWGPDSYPGEEDSLQLIWSESNKISVPKNPKCWMNPPYGRGIGKWVQKAYEESLKGAKVCCLLPARTDTKWFHEYCAKGQVILLRGRLKFEGAEHGAPFPSMLVLFGYGEPSIKADSL